MLSTFIARLTRCTAAVVAISGLALGAVPVSAAVTIEALPDADRGLVRVAIGGTIERGDAQRVQTFLAGLPKGQRIVIELASQGGSIEEALRIGRHIHANRIGTAVTGKGQQCLSACALTFLAGRDAQGRPDRIKGRQAEIGFHAFRRIVADKDFTVADMHEAVASSQQTLLVIADYLSTVEAGIGFMGMMLAKPSTSMTWLTNDRAPSLGVGLVD
jgi:hypothetical protein